MQYRDVQVGDTILLPGRAGQPDTYYVFKKYGNRVILRSLLRKGELRHLTDNQFNIAGYEAIRNATLSWQIPSEND